MASYLAARAGFNVRVFSDGDGLVIRTSDDGTTSTYAVTTNYATAQVVAAALNGATP